MAITKPRAVAHRYCRCSPGTSVRAGSSAIIVVRLALRSRIFPLIAKHPSAIGLLRTDRFIRSLTGMIAKGRKHVITMQHLRTLPNRRKNSWEKQHEIWSRHSWNFIQP